MNLLSITLSLAVMVLQVASLTAVSADTHGVYYHELKSLKADPETRIMFDKDAHQGLSQIQRDLIMFKNMTDFQQFVNTLFLALDVVVVTHETMPLLYSYVDSICVKAGIATPTVFITRHNWLFNAMAQKLFMSNGGILIGQKLIKELSDDALEAFLAHEVGHIKYNHANKELSLFAVEMTFLIMLCYKLGILSDINFSDKKALIKKCIQFFICDQITSFLPALIINKRFEKEADEFAYKTNDKGPGLVEFLELLLKKDQLREEDFVFMYELLQENKSKISLFQYYSLMMNYYVAYAGQLYTNAYMTMYHETFMGAHPSHEARIAAARKYMATQKA